MTIHPAFLCHLTTFGSCIFEVICYLSFVNTMGFFMCLKDVLAITLMLYFVSYYLISEQTSDSCFLFTSIYSSLSRDLEKIVLTSRICQNQVLLSSLILGVLHLNTRITAMLYQHAIIGPQRLYWVSLVYSNFMWHSMYIYFEFQCFIVHRPWMELSVRFMECWLHTCWTLLCKSQLGYLL